MTYACGAHLVGSLAAPTAADAFRQTAATLGRHLRRASDGETRSKRPGTTTQWVHRVAGVAPRRRRSSWPALPGIVVDARSGASEPAANAWASLGGVCGVVAAPNDLRGSLSRLGGHWATA